MFCKTTIIFILNEKNLHRSEFSEHYQKIRLIPVSNMISLHKTANGILYVCGNVHLYGVHSHICSKNQMKFGEQNKFSNYFLLQLKQTSNFFWIYVFRAESSLPVSKTPKWDQIDLKSDAVADRWHKHRIWDVVVVWNFWWANVELSKVIQLSVDGRSGLYCRFLWNAEPNTRDGHHIWKAAPKSAVQLIFCTCLQSFCCTKVSRHRRANNFTTYTQDSMATCKLPTRNAIWLLSAPDSCPGVMWENDTAWAKTKQRPCWQFRWLSIVFFFIVMGLLAYHPFPSPFGGLFELTEGNKKHNPEMCSLLNYRQRC